MEENKKKLVIFESKKEGFKFINDFKEIGKSLNQAEWFIISRNHALLYWFDSNKPNEYLADFGSTLNGVCVIMANNSEDGESIDIEDDILEKLPKIFEADKKAREDYHNALIASGVKIISI